MAEGDATVTAADVRRRVGWLLIAVGVVAIDLPPAIVGRLFGWSSWKTLTGFDLLPDVIGYLMMAAACRSLCRSVPRFSRAQLWALTAAAASALYLLLDMHLAITGSRATGLPFGGRPTYGQTVLDAPTSIVARLVAAAVTWSILTGLADLTAGPEGPARIAFGSFWPPELPKLSRRTRSIRNGWLLLFSAVLALGLAPGQVFRSPTLLVGAGFVMAVVSIAIFWAMYATWDGLGFFVPQAELTSNTTDDKASTGRLNRVLAGSAVLLFVITGTYDLSTRRDPTSPTLLSILDRQPADLIVEPDGLTMNRTSEPTHAWMAGVETSAVSEVVPPGLRPQSCDIRRSMLTAIDLTTGTLAWSQEIPVQPQADVVTMGDDVIVVDPLSNAVPVSVAAIDAATGRIRWQKFLPTGELRVHGVGVDDDRVALISTPWSFHLTRSTDLFVIAADGTELSRETGNSIFAIRESDQKTAAGIRLIDQVDDVAFANRVIYEEYNYAEWLELMAMVPPADKPLEASQGLYYLTTYPVYRLHRLDPQTGTGHALPFIVPPGRSDRIGDDNYPGSPFQQGLGYLTIVRASEGTYHLFVVDLDSATIRWDVGPVRAAAAAGSNILLDLDDASTPGNRRMDLVSSDGPTKKQWSLPLMPNLADGNGYVGLVGDRLVFYVAGDDASISVAEGNGRFLALPASAGSSAGSMRVSEVRAAGDWTAGPGPSTHVDDRWIAVIDGAHLVWAHVSALDEEPERLDMTHLGWSRPNLAVVGDTAIIGWTRPTSCD